MTGTKLYRVRVPGSDSSKWGEGVSNVYPTLHGARVRAGLERYWRRNPIVEVADLGDWVEVE